MNVTGLAAASHSLRGSATAGVSCGAVPGHVPCACAAVEIPSWAYRRHRRARFQTGDSPGAGHQLGEAAGRLARCPLQQAQGQIGSKSGVDLARAESPCRRDPRKLRPPDFPAETSSEAFRTANADRASDLSAKRNIGLLLARLHGWNKIAFLDDDITISRPSNIARLAAQLDRHQVAGMIVRKHPDNSVVCHARRDAGLQQDVFLTGAALGVHCNSLPLSFFPDIYNEDWFFFAREAAGRQLPRVGHAKQPEYDPYASLDRARCEEFGDLLAEGLYALLADEDSSLPFSEQLRGATRGYWSRFIEARRQVLTETKTLLVGLLDKHGTSGRASSAIASLEAAGSQLDKITADLCVNFISAWREDLAEWQKFSNAVNSVGSTVEALDSLCLKTWTIVESERTSGCHRLR
jgi:glycosyltransferase involved in cell wall biosynthesis